MLVIYIHLPFSVQEEETFLWHGATFFYQNICKQMTFYYLQGFFPSMLYKDSTTCVQ